MLRKIILLCFLIAPVCLQAQQFQSTDQASHIIELYTSEGCSSCPPADRWLSSFKQHPQLFKTLFPLAFHVDYWDYLGWKDPYARSQYSHRQRGYKQNGGLSQVYTPGVIINGIEWRGWFRQQAAWPTPIMNKAKMTMSISRNISGNISGRNSGRISGKISGGRQLRVQLENDRQAVVLHLAILAVGVQSQVEAGENKGRLLKHDFVVLDYQQFSGIENWSMPLAEINQVGQQQTALVAWVTQPGTMTPIQVVGGYIN